MHMCVLAIDVILEIKTEFLNSGIHKHACHILCILTHLVVSEKFMKEYNREEKSNIFLV